ncbi:MAG: ATPase involved in chromosome partitioning-like protein [Myxococcales bacterium]|nr:ATPase involved in chromosome partitioning-like protein [Myxococcales bacterium]
MTSERTAPPARVTAPMGAVRVKPGPGKSDLDDQTRMMDPVDTARHARFLNEELVRTSVTPQTQQQQQRRRPPEVSMNQKTQEMPAMQESSVIISSQQVLTKQAPPELLAELASQSSNVELRVNAPAEPPRTQVWVATHKPPDDPDERLILVREPDSARAASFRVLRHRLQERGDPRVIAVTSARAGEGKTTCAVNLALALGECGRARVLLIEANLRTPALAPLFGFMPPECFTDQMARHKTKPLDPWSVVEVFSPSLHVLAVKPDNGGGRPLLDGPAFAIAIEVLAQAGYDYLVLDTPAVLGAADVNLIEESADGVLFAARSRETSARTLRAAVEQLSPAKLLGMTLLDV